MKGKNYNVIGVMSGTSLDGVDCAFCKIDIEPTTKTLETATYSAQIITAQTIPYISEWQHKLSTAHTLSEVKRSALDTEYTQYLAQVIHTFITENNLDAIDVICSHGHTVLHQPEKGVTVQIGNKKELARLTKHKVVCDFRVQDVQLGGQGAPLVPIGDRLLFSQYDYCLNLGGFANVSMEQDGARVAYDICPVNVVLNRYAQQLGKAYDDAGAFAKAGTVHAHLLEALNKISFYTMPAPKSLGIEWVHEHIFPLIEAYRLPPMDVLATFTEHVAFQLAQSFGDGGNVLVTGGGAYNTYLQARVAALFASKEHFCATQKTYSSKSKPLQLTIPETHLLEFKEALIFALLGVLKLEDAPNCLSSVTGATRDHSSGVVFKA